MKLVREHINEIFVQDSDPIHDLGIGIEHCLKDFPLHFFRKDTENLIYVMEIHEKYILLHCNEPTIQIKFGKKHSSTIDQYLKDYYVKIAKDSGFYNSVLIYPKPVLTSVRGHVTAFRFTIGAEYRKKMKPGNFRKAVRADAKWDKKRVITYP